MRFCIPPLNTSIVLTQDWIFQLHHEGRNESLFAAFQLPFDRWGYAKLPPAIVTLPAGTRLSIARYYIRQGAKDFDSVSFRLPSQVVRGAVGAKGRGGKVHGRFWVKLECANNAVFDVVPS